MNDLRLILLGLGICVIAGIYVWGSLQHRKRQRHQTIQDQPSIDNLTDVKITAKVVTDVDYSSALAGLNRTISDSRKDVIQTNLKDTESHVPAFVQNDKQQGIEGKNLQSSASAEITEARPASGRSQAEVNISPQQIITLHIIPRAQEMLRGGDILAATNELDMAMDEMKIFQHFGIGEMKMESALFSLANMMEPGYFDINTMEDFSSPGLVMFMSLPAAIDGQVVFELMLNTAQRLAQILGADVCDENRTLINEQKIESIRSKIVSWN